MAEENQKLQLASDYMEGAYPGIIERLASTNLIKTEGYGLDAYSESAKAKIREACGCAEAEIYFLVGGTQTNATVIDAVLKSYQGVLSPDSGHVSIHEAGAIEMGGHKVLALPHELGKVTAETVEAAITDYWNDGNNEHMVMPGMVYISQPTEYGTLYSLNELTAISNVCREHKLPLYVDGARLAYALASPQNDVTLKDLARLCDIFYIGGTKCGALFGEAVVIPQGGLIPRFFSIIKQHGALLAKGRLLGIQFDTLFTDGLYLHIGEPAIRCAKKIKTILRENGFKLYFDSPTNQIFVVLENGVMAELEQNVTFSFWERYDESHTVVRFATSWAATEADVERFHAVIRAVIRPAQ